MNQLPATLRTAARLAARAALLVPPAASLGQSGAPVNPTAPAGRPPAGQAAVAAAAPAAGGPAAPAAAPAGRPSLDQVLDALDQRGQSLNSFTANVELVEQDYSTALESTRLGKIYYQRLADGQARIRVSFTELRNGKTRRPEAKDYVLDGGWLVERDHDRKIEIRRQVLKPGQKMDLFRLGDGPFPMPIGQKKDDVKAQFAAKLVPLTPEDKNLPAGASHLVLEPRGNTELRRQFKAIDVFVDPATQMPVRIDTLDSKEEKSRSTTLQQLQVNPPLRNADFELPKIDKAAGWQETVEPLKQ